MPENTARWRAIVSPATAVAFIAVGGTGVLMLAGVRGGLRELHEAAGLLFVLVGVLHVILNWRALVGYFKRPAAIVSLAVAAAVLVLLAAVPDDHSGRSRGEGRIRSGRAFEGSYR